MGGFRPYSRKYVGDEDETQDAIYTAIKEILELKGTEGYAKYKRILLSDVAPVNLLIRASEMISTLGNLVWGENEADKDAAEMAKELDDMVAQFKTELTCPRCGEPLYLSDLPDYEHVCYNCDENF